MLCPACKSTLEHKEYHGIILDRCPKCKGVWFDYTELENFITVYNQRHPELPYDSIELHRKSTDPSKLNEAIRFCPRCEIDLRKSNYAMDSNIIIDRCRTCEGIWLDRAEVKRLAIFIKGNPKLDKMGNSMAEHDNKQQEFKDNLEGISDFNRRWYGNSSMTFRFLTILPLSDDTKKMTVPFFTYAILLFNILILLWMYYSVRDFNVVFLEFGVIPSNIMAGSQLHTTITSQFLHAGILHVVGNSLFLWIFADNVEDRMGHFKFISFYLFCGICASLTYTFLNPSSTIPCVGASGAVGGVLGAYFIFYPKANVRTFIINDIYTIPAAAYLGGWLVWQIASYFMYRGDSSISFSSHIGGFVTGLLIALLFKKLRFNEIRE